MPACLWKKSLWLSSATRNLIFHKNSFSELLPWLVCLVSRRTFCTQNIIPHDLERTRRAELNELGVIVEDSCAFILKDFLDFNHSAFVKRKWPSSVCSILFKNYHERWMLTRKLLRKIVYRCNGVTMSQWLSLLWETVRPSMIFTV